MKLCVITSLYPPYSRGGAEVVVEKIVNGLVRQGNPVVLVTLGRRPGIERTGNLTIYRVRPLNIFSFLDIQQWSTWVRLLWHPLDMLNISSYRQVSKILRMEKPDAVCTHNLKGIGYLIPLAIRRVGIRHIHTVHDVQLSRPSGLILVGQEKPFVILDKVYEKICRRLFGDPTWVVSPSQWLLTYYRRLGFFYHSQHLVLPNPVEFKKIEKTGAGERPAGITFLFAGQLESAKGIRLLLDACQDLPTTGWRLLIVGGGSLGTEVKQRIAGDKRFEFVGRVDRQRMPEMYRQADITVVPSLCYENSPAVISESLVANVPVVAADIGGIGEMVKDNVNGFTFAAGNTENLTTVLRHFIEHPERIDELKKNCFVSVREHSLDRYLKRLLAIIEK